MSALGSVLGAALNGGHTGQEHRSGKVRNSGQNLGTPNLEYNGNKDT